MPELSAAVAGKPFDSPAPGAAGRGRVAAVLAFSLLASCAPPLPATLDLSWRFADDRRCTDAGANTVAILADGDGTLGCADATCVYACADGEPGHGVTISLVKLTQPHIRLEARSAQGQVLYRGELNVDGAARGPSDAAAATDATASGDASTPNAWAEVVLYYTGGK